MMMASFHVVLAQLLAAWFTSLAVSVLLAVPSSFFAILADMCSPGTPPMQAAAVLPATAAANRQGCLLRHLAHRVSGSHAHMHTHLVNPYTQIDKDAEAGQKQTTNTSSCHGTTHPPDDGCALAFGASHSLSFLPFCFFFYCAFVVVCLRMGGSLVSPQSHTLVSLSLSFHSSFSTLSLSLSRSANSSDEEPSQGRRSSYGRNNSSTTNNKCTATAVY